MKMFKRIISLAVFLLFVINCMIIIPIMATIKTEALESDPINTGTYFNFRSCLINDDITQYIDKYTIKPVLDTNDLYFLGNNNIVVSYLISEDVAIDSFEYSQVGFNVVNVSVDGNNDRRITVELSCLPNQIEYHFQLDTVLEDDTELSNDLYAVNNQYGSFISQFSTDHAYENYYDYALCENILTQSQYENIKAEANQNIVISIYDQELVGLGYDEIPISNEPISDGYGRLAGRILWEDDVHDINSTDRLHPLRRVAVRAYQKDALGNYSFLCETTTEDDGSFNIDVPAETDVFIRIYAGDDNVMVKSWGELSGYFYQYPTGFNVLEGNVGVISQKAITMDQEAGRAFQISQAIITARDYAEMMMNEELSDVSVMYPCGDWASYTPVLNKIWISDYDEKGDKTNFYREWDVLLHEYGHHVEMECGIIFSPFLLEHENYINLADEFNNLFIGSQMGWSESWNEIFADMALKYYSTEEVVLHNIVGVNGENQGCDNEFINDYLGEACELSVIGVLWDLLDGENDYIIQIDDDNIDLTDSQFWALTTISGTTSFSDCVNNFYTIYPELVPAIAERLSWYEMAPTQPAVLNTNAVSYSVAPQISWLAQGGSTNYPNNKFDIVIFKKNTSGEYQEIYTVEDLTTTSYTFSASQWSAIMAANGSIPCESSKIYISIKGYNDSSLIEGDHGLYEWSTGPYYSEFKEVNVASLNSHSYTECRKIDVNNHATYCVHCNNMQPGSTDGHLWTPLDDNWVECMECGYSKKVGGLGPFIPVIHPEAIDPEEDEIETE